MPKRIDSNKYLIDLRWTENGKRRRRRITVSGSRKDAERYEARLRSEQKAGNLVAQQTVEAEVATFAAFEKTWFQSYVIPNNKASEQDNKRSYLDHHILPYFGATPIDSITHYMVEQFIAQQVKRGYAPATVNLHLSTLKRALKSAVEWGLLKENPAAGVSKIRNDAESWQFLDREEAVAFLTAVPKSWYPLFLLATRTGLRAGEVCALRWRDIDWTNKVLHVRHSVYKGELTTPKSKDSVRAVPLTADVVEVLRSVRKENLKSDFVFPNRAGGPLAQRTLNRPLRTANKHSGLSKRMRFHDLRHTFASHLVMAGVPIRTVKDLMGHSSLDMTLRYAHITDETLREAVEQLEEWVVLKRSTQVESE